MKKYFRIVLVFILVVPLYSQSGKLSVGFDIDDTIVYSRNVFLNIPEERKNPLDYGWINSNDCNYSVIIGPVFKLVQYFRSNGHDIFFITSRQGKNGRILAEYLSAELGFPVAVGKNLFFSPKHRAGDHSYTTKNLKMRRLNLDIYYGDSDTDMIAALKADVHPVRIVRHASSVDSYSSNYFGDTVNGNSTRTPFTRSDLLTFYLAHIGIFGESIYPIVWEGPDPETLFNHNP